MGEQPKPDGHALRISIDLGHLVMAWGFSTAAARAARAGFLKFASQSRAERHELDAVFQNLHLTNLRLSTAEDVKTWCDLFHRIYGLQFDQLRQGQLFDETEPVSRIPHLRSGSTGHFDWDEALSHILKEARQSNHSVKNPTGSPSGVAGRQVQKAVETVLRPIVTPTIPCMYCHKVAVSLKTNICGGCGKMNNLD